jgi:heat shock protein HslJ
MMKTIPFKTKIKALILILLILLIFSLAACRVLQNPTEIPLTKDISSFPTLIASPSVSDLQGVTWILDMYQDQKGNSINPISGTAITAAIENGEISGEAGCNIYGGSFTLTDGNIQVEDIFVTERYCLEPEGLMQQEQAYFNALGSVNQFIVSNNRLQLKDQAGATVLIFIKQE